MSRTPALVRIPVGRFPRVSGDEPKADPRVPDADVFSPRERG